MFRVKDMRQITPITCIIADEALAVSKFICVVYGGMHLKVIMTLTIRCNKRLPPQSSLIAADPVTKSIPKKIALYSTSQVKT